MNKPTIYADFQNLDRQGCQRLTCRGTLSDLTRLGLQLEEGMSILLSDGEVEADAIAQFSQEEQIWVALIDWERIRQKVRVDDV